MNLTASNQSNMKKANVKCCYRIAKLVYRLRSLFVFFISMIKSVTDLLASFLSKSHSVSPSHFLPHLLTSKHLLRLQTGIRNQKLRFEQPRFPQF